MALGFYDGYVRDLDINTRKIYLAHQIEKKIQLQSVPVKAKTTIEGVIVTGD